MPRDHKLVGLPHRYIDNIEYKANSGLINMYLMSQAPYYPGLSLDAPVYNMGNVAIPVAGVNYPPFPLLSLQNQLGKAAAQKRFIDLRDKRLVDKAALLSYVTADPKGWLGDDFLGIDPANH